MTKALQLLTCASEGDMNKKQTTDIPSRNELTVDVQREFGQSMQKLVRGFSRKHDVKQFMWGYGMKEHEKSYRCIP